MSKAELAVACFKEGFACSQAVFSTYAPDLGLDRETALKIAAAFGGGIARTGDICGAVSGALMVLSLRHAVTFASEDEKQKLYNLARELIASFRERNGAIICRQLLNCDLGTPEGHKYAKERKLTATICPKYIRDAAVIVEQLL
jgi:C_GCAxxG_C_C family probable redox protein